MTEPLLWTRQELATQRVLKCGLTKVTALISSGELASIMIGGQRLVRDSDLRRFIEGRPVELPSDKAAA